MIILGFCTISFVEYVDNMSVRIFVHVVYHLRSGLDANTAASLAEAIIESQLFNFFEKNLSSPTDPTARQFWDEDLVRLL